MEINPGEIWISRLGIWGLVTVISVDNPMSVTIQSASGQIYPVSRNMFIHWFRKTTKLERYLNSYLEGEDV